MVPAPVGQGGATRRLPDLLYRAASREITAGPAAAEARGLAGAVQVQLVDPGRQRRGRGRLEARLAVEGAAGAEEELTLGLQAAAAVAVHAGPAAVPLAVERPAVQRLAGDWPGMAVGGVVGNVLTLRTGRSRPDPPSKRHGQPCQGQRTSSHVGA